MTDYQTAKQHTLAQFERNYLIRLLSLHEGNVSRAAESSGQNRRTLQRLMSKHGVDRRRPLASGGRSAPSRRHEPDVC